MSKKIFSAIVFGANMRPTKFRNVTNLKGLERWIERNWRDKKVTAINYYNSDGGFHLQTKIH